MLPRSTFRYSAVGAVIGQMMMAKYSTGVGFAGRVMAKLQTTGRYWSMSPRGTFRYSTAGVVIGQISTIVVVVWIHF